VAVGTIIAALDKLGGDGYLIMRVRK
jgi:hypothetical protein